ncbi:UNVERIFIED_CONTAM: hypothetical protein PYX00_003701 [Menopon gallinae]|uniref:Malate dehydrogenase, mitochondrial n=1 Tax=Menopon gallinae TaxID=328185 RepID=A0AAW2I204_9NEOP
MQSSRLFRRNNQKILGIFPQRLWPSRSFSLSSVKRRSADESGCCESSCCDPGESSDDNIKVTVIGAAGRVGRTLSLLLKTSPLVDQLCMFDVDKSVKGICMDISHIDTKCCVSHVTGMCNIQEALEDPDVVLIAAGCPMTPEIDSKQLFRKNAPIVAGLSEAFARFCPEACLVLITSPINSLLPVAGEVYELVTGEKPTSRLFGLTTLDVVRANTFTAEAVRRDPSNVIVPVIGGTSQDTIVPVISQMKPCCRIKHEEVIALTECVKQAEESLTDCQNCGTRGASSLSTAYAAFRFTSSLISALKGEQDIIECAYVQSNILPELEYMASPIKLGVCGMEYNYGYPRLSEYEVKLMENGAVALRSDINMGKLYVSENSTHLMKKVKDKALDDSRTTQTCKMLGITEVNEPEEVVSLNNCKAPQRGGPLRSKLRRFSKSEGPEASHGLLAVFPNLIEQAIGNRSLKPDNIPPPTLAPSASTVARELDERYHYFKQASIASYPFIIQA